MPRSVQKEFRAVTLTVAPSTLATAVYGSPRAAEKKLGLRRQAFHSWDRSQRIPKTVWDHLRRKRPAYVDQVTAEEVPVGGRPFLVPTKLVDRTDTPASAAPLDAVQRYITELEQENQALKQRLEVVRQTLLDQR